MGECLKEIESLFGTGIMVLEDSLPFNHSTINKHCNFNVNNKNTVIRFSLENTRFSLNYVWQYLAHTQVQFCLQNDSSALTDSFIEQNLWFNKNNISFSLFEARKELAKEIIFKSCLLLKKVSTSQQGSGERNELSTLTLGQMSLLNFQDKIVEEYLDIILQANESIVPDISEEAFLKGRYVMQKLKPATSVLLRILGIGGE
jgi:hypothetical protein